MEGNDSNPRSLSSSSAQLPESMPGSDVDFLPGSALVDERLRYVRDVLQDQGHLLQGRVMTVLQAEFISFQESVCAFLAAVQVGEGDLSTAQQQACVSMDEEETALAAGGPWSTGQLSPNRIAKQTDVVDAQTQQLQENEAVNMTKLVTLSRMFGNASSILRAVLDR